jgi:Bacterial SH3 domain
MPICGTCRFVTPRAPRGTAAAAFAFGAREDGAPPPRQSHGGNFMSIKTVRGLIGAAGALVLAAALAGCVAPAPAAPPYAAAGMPYYPPAYGIPPGSPMAGRLVTTAPLHLRAGPSARARILATLPPGMPVLPLPGRAGNWLEVQTGYGAGWVYARYLAPG